eukprot:g1285.t1
MCWQISLSSGCRISRAVRVNGATDEFTSAASVTRSPTRSPSIRRPNRYLEEEESHRIDPRLLVKQTHTLLQSDSIIRLSSVRDLLSEVGTILDRKSSLSPDEAISLAGVVGTLLLKSPLKSSDPDLVSLVHGLIKKIETEFDNFQVSDLCLFVWFFGCFGPTILKSPEYLTARKSVTSLTKMIENRGVNTLKDALRLFWGIERMKLHGHSSVTFKTSQRIIGEIRNCPPERLSDLASLLLIASKLRVHDGMEFLRKIAQFVKYRFPDFTDEAMRDFVTGFAIYDLQKFQFIFERFCEELENRMMVMELPVFITILLSLSKITFLPNKRLLDGLEKRVMNFGGQFTSRLVTNCIQVLAQLRYSSPELLSRLMKSFSESLNEYSIAQICCILASCARLEELNKERLLIGLEAISKQLPSGMDKTSRMFLYQILTHASVVLQLDVSDELIPYSWQNYCKEEWIKGQSYTVLKKQSSLASAVSSLGLDIHEELSPKGNIMVQYVQLKNTKQKIVLDLIYTRFHCFFNVPYVLLAWKRWQQKILQLEGYRVLYIHEERWSQVPKDKRVRFLENKLLLKQQRELTTSHHLKCRKRTTLLYNSTRDVKNL